MFIYIEEFALKTPHFNAPDLQTDQTATQINGILSIQDYHLMVTS